MLIVIILVPYEVVVDLGHLVSNINICPSEGSHCFWE